MKKFKKWCAALLLTCMAVLTGLQTVAAAPGGNDTEYTYTVTFYAGNQGRFTSTNGIQVDNHKTESSYKISSPQDGGDKITVTGLKYGDIVSVRAQSSVSLQKSKYYIGGIRESGQDNGTVSKSAFKVEGDREYVVAYGIKGNMVAYTVHYVDEEGNALLESETYYGAVGDRPVIAFRYVDGYWPQTYNLTKQLSANEADNVFTFVYTPMFLDVEGEDEEEVVYVEDPNGNNDDDANANIEEEDPSDLINLDEQDVPLAYQLMEKVIEFAKEKPLEFMGLSVLILGLLAALILMIIFKRKKKKNEDEADPNSGTESKEEKNE
ncbi:MAG: MucBP domain-containing protein [Agathobacter sp.]|nr:MucBP domain-containing protein [Agathobacter sp.]